MAILEGEGPQGPITAIEIEIPEDLAKFLDPVGGGGSLIKEEWVKRGLEIAMIEGGHVASRTPVRTGALKDSVRAVKGAGGLGFATTGTGLDGAKSIATVYFDDEPQMVEWSRVYAPYQEGPPLGLSTYTNPPRQPLYLADPKDLPDIQQWAESVALDVTMKVVP